jgi:hypothetical protein
MPLAGCKRWDRASRLALASFVMAVGGVLSLADELHPRPILMQNKRLARVEREEELEQQLRQLNDKANKPVFAIGKRARDEEDDAKPPPGLSDRQEEHLAGHASLFCSKTHTNTPQCTRSDNIQYNAMQCNAMQCNPPARHLRLWMGREIQTMEVHEQEKVALTRSCPPVPQPDDRADGAQAHVSHPLHQSSVHPDDMRPQPTTSCIGGGRRCTASLLGWRAQRHDCVVAGGIPSILHLSLSLKA